MATARLPLRNVALDPASLRVAEEVLDEVWASLERYIGKDESACGAARMRLANIVLDLAKDGQLDTLQITRTAARLMARRSRVRHAGRHSKGPD